MLHEWLRAGHDATMIYWHANDNHNNMYYNLFSVVMFLQIKLILVTNLK